MSITPADKRRAAEVIMQSLVKKLDAEKDPVIRRRGNILYELCREYLAWQTEHVLTEAMEDVADESEAQREV